MAYQLPSNVPLHQPAVSPYASSSHSARGIGHGLPSFRHSKFKLIALLLLVGIATAALVAIVAPSGTVGQANKAAQLELNATSTAKDQATPDTTAKAADQAAGSNLNVSVSGGSGGNQSSVNTQVTVNGQPVAVPDNGTTQQTVTNPDGSTTSYSVSASTQGGTNNSSSTSTNLSVSSNSSSNNGGSTSGYNVVNGVQYSY
jgi:hypothetical protein